MDLNNFAAPVEYMYSIYVRIVCKNRLFQSMQSVFVGIFGGGLAAAP